MGDWKRWNNTQGLTLIELLLTTVFLSVAFLGIGSMTVSSIRGLSFSDHLTTGLTLAKDRIEQIEHVPYVNVTQANFPRENYGAIEGYEPFRRDMVIVDNMPEPNMKTVTVTVSWREMSGDTKDVVVTTIVAQ